MYVYPGVINGKQTVIIHSNQYRNKLKTIFKNLHKQANKIFCVSFVLMKIKSH